MQCHWATVALQCGCPSISKRSACNSYVRQKSAASVYVLRFSFVIACCSNTGTTGTDCSTVAAMVFVSTKIFLVENFSCQTMLLDRLSIGAIQVCSMFICHRSSTIEHASYYTIRMESIECTSDIGHYAKHPGSSDTQCVLHFKPSNFHSKAWSLRHFSYVLRWIGCVFLHNLALFDRRIPGWLSHFTALWFRTIKLFELFSMLVKNAHAVTGKWSTCCRPAIEWHRLLAPFRLEALLRSLSQRESARRSLIIWIPTFVSNLLLWPKTERAALFRQFHFNF